MLPRLLHGLAGFRRGDEGVDVQLVDHVGFPAFYWVSPIVVASTLPAVGVASPRQ